MPKIQKLSDRQKSKGQVSDIILDASMKFQNYPIKTVGKMHFIATIFYIIISKISKIRQKYKNSPIIKKSTSQDGDIILDTCIKFGSYPTKTVGGDRF